MPLIDELPTAVLSHYFSADYLATRSPGPHLKMIVDDFLAYYNLHDRRNADFADSLEEFASLGFAWERTVVRALLDTGAIPQLDEATPAAVVRIYERAFSLALNEAELERRPRELIKPGEGTYDGIHYTPDMVNVRLPGPEEWKCTWTSASRGLEAHPDWLMQLCGYCHAEGFDTAVLRAFYVNGYYEKMRMGKPVVRAWRIKWSDDELAENWHLLREHKSLMIAEGRMEDIS